jgi:SAM-dependent methyltransferase
MWKNSITWTFSSAEECGLEKTMRRKEWRSEWIPWRKQVGIVRRIWLKEQRAAQELLQMLPPLSGVTMDLGCGTGDSFFPATADLKLIGLDRSPDRLKKARRTMRHSLLAADVRYLPCKNRSIVLFTAIGLAEYLRDLNPLIREVTRTAQPGAFLLLTSSPGNLFGLARMPLGERIFMRRADKVSGLFTRQGFAMLAHRHLATQDLFLLRFIG